MNAFSVTSSRRMKSGWPNSAGSESAMTTTLACMGVYRHETLDVYRGAELKIIYPYIPGEYAENELPADDSYGFR